ncbi:MAG: extracellular solute-binding protein, partial [Ktedonobacteraceae bacterium]|nr:extracellular solute-binding protein [Ktedonobacteraceae bacterium]
AQKLTQRQGGKITRAGLQMGITGISSQQTFATFLYQNGGTLLDKDNTEVAWNSEQGVKALQFMVDLYNGPNAVGKNTNINYGTLPPTQQPLVTGEAAMALVGSGALAGIQKAKPDIMKNIAVMPPIGQTQKAAYGGAGTGLFINKDSKHADAAWSFIQYMVSVDTLKQYTSVTGTVPARSSFINSDVVQKNTFMKPYLEAMSAKAFRPNPNIASWVQVRDILARYLEKSIVRQMTPTAALNAAAQEAGSLLAKK